jgi:hypothetical protein
MSRRRKNIHSRHAAAAVTKPTLDRSEQALASAFADGVDRFQRLAGALGNAEDDAIMSLLSDLDVAVVNAAAAAKGVNLIPLVLQEDTASKVALGFLAEWRELGREVPGEVGPERRDWLDDALSDTADMVDDVESLDVVQRVSLYSSDRTAAALALGVHLARGGDNDPFFHAPWSLHAVGVSLLAAAAASATLALAAVSSGADEETLPQTSVRGLAAAAWEVYAAMDPRDTCQIDGFGTASRVVEEALDAVDWVEGLEAVDAHRLSALLLPAFTAGVSGGSYPFGDRETAAPGRMVLEAAFAAGRMAGEGGRKAGVRIAIPAAVPEHGRPALLN